MKRKSKQKPGGVSTEGIQRKKIDVCFEKNQEEPNIWIQDKLTLFLFPQLKSVNLELLKKTHSVKYSGLSIGSSQTYSYFKEQILLYTTSQNHGILESGGIKWQCSLTFISMKFFSQLFHFQSHLILRL